MLMTRVAAPVTVLVLAAVLAASAAASSRSPLTQASSGRTIHLRKGADARLRLSNRWRWTEPAASTRAVELTPVEYLVDPGFREWTIQAHRKGRATIRAVGKPNSTGGARTTRHFDVTIVVGQ
jgi:predicted secreted protein